MKTARRTLCPLLLGLAAGLLLQPSAGLAQLTPGLPGGHAATPKATWTARLLPADARAGEGAQVVVTAAIEPGWHIYAPNSPKNGPIPTSIALGKDAKALVPAGRLAGPTPEKVHDPGFDIDVTEYAGTVAIGIPVTVAAKASGAQKATVEVQYQACNASQCLPPEAVKAPLTFRVAAGPARADHKKPIASVPKQPGAPASKSADDAAGAAIGATTATTGAPPSAPGSGATSPASPASGGLIPFLWLAVVAGLTALLTPCVFPMVPITVSFFMKKPDEKGTSVARPLAYCLGIICTFTVVGVVAAAIFGASTIQKFANSPWTNLALAVLFIVLAANLFGAYEIVVPSWLVNRAAAGRQRGGLAGPFFMGLAFALTSFTCTVAFVGTLLVLAAQHSYFYPIVGMLVFSTVFALPFFLLALFPRWLERLPKSGGWMVTVKAFLGFLELAAALKFLSNADLVWSAAWLTRPVFLAVWAAIFVIAALYLVGWLRLGHDTEGQKVGWTRRAFGIAAAVVGLFCLAGVRGNSLGSQIDPYLPPKHYPGLPGSGSEGVSFLPKYSWAQAIAHIENKPIFINFTGVNCTNCRQMEQYVLPRPEVTAQLANFIPVELYTDRGTPDDDRNKATQQDLAHAVTLPLYVVVTPDGKVVRSFDKGYTRDPQEFVRFLKDAEVAARPLLDSPARTASRQ